jgi:hypothetical protein
MTNQEIKQAFVNAMAIYNGQLTLIRLGDDRAFLSLMDSLEHTVKATRADLTVWHYIDMEEYEDDEL